MTIERQWVEIMKMEVPEAFTDAIPRVPTHGFIDAQIKLMAMPKEHSWEEYLRRQFCMPIISMIALGVKTTVLAFDDYLLVPKAKAITQAKRREKLEPIQFVAGDALPDRPPDKWPDAMANRAFKREVVHWIMRELPSMACEFLPEQHSIVFDYDGDSCCQYTKDSDGTMVESKLPRQAEGEADIKFVTWCKTFQSAVAVEAIDGDFLPIALASRCNDIFIRRYKVGEGFNFEWVNIDCLRSGMVAIMRATKPREILITWTQWEIDCLIALIGITGTDYSRGLPLIKPKKIWTMLPTLLPLLTNRCFEVLHDEARLVPVRSADILYRTIYASQFKSHVKDSYSYQAVWDSLQQSKLSKRNKDAFPSFARAITTCLNVNFILEYWNGHKPDSMMPDYGFVEVDGEVKWQDQV
jgi:hypothetical protein